jgi:hypothetical protein
MSRKSPASNDLVVPSNFIRAVRESGYLSLSSALAELVDNSLQASSSRIAISIVRESPDAFPEIVVEDNGTGMSPIELEMCLSFGGSSRFGARESFGRFGMGLPAASLSQARCVEVTSWRGDGPEYRVSLDIDAVVANGSLTLDATSAGRSTGESGCRVRWMDCDRIEYRRLAWLEKSLRRDLGRMYRRFLTSGVSITVNGTQVEAVDPMLLNERVEGATASLAFEELEYEIGTTVGTTSIVKVRFAILPVDRWHHLDNVTKRRAGIVGSGGVSILRSGREIAFGWHLMGRKRKENYDDWWRCEIEFEPALDEHFGITINKQGIRPSAALRDALEPDLEAIARMLNVRVQRAFEEVKFQAATEVSCRIASAVDSDLPVIVSSGKGGVGALRYRIGSEAMPTELMFSSTLEQRTLDLTLNIDHPAFVALFHALQSIDGEASAGLRTSLELLLLSFARSAAQMEHDGQSVDELLRVWSKTYGRMLQKS